MSKRTLLVIGSVVLMGGAIAVSAPERASHPDGGEKKEPVKYEAEEGLPKDKAGKKRRDYAVLEAALNDLASPKNPEYKNRIRSIGPGREIVIGDTWEYDLPIDDLRRMSDNIDNKDVRSIPADIQEDFKRRNVGPAGSLEDFKPANPDILVRDLDKEFKDSDDFVRDFLRKYPTAWGYVWAYPPGYSKDGKTAIVVFEGGPNGTHGLNWAYLLIKKGKRWEVQWRNCRYRE